MTQGSSYVILYAPLAPFFRVGICLNGGRSLGCPTSFLHYFVLVRLSWHCCVAYSAFYDFFVFLLYVQSVKTPQLKNALFELESANRKNPIF